ncbi:hypothetical protein MMC17_006581 [Xylographa soralifera]|nr:hypothetical protein [Xylographa soralifera]
MNRSSNFEGVGQVTGTTLLYLPNEMLGRIIEFVPRYYTRNVLSKRFIIEDKQLQEHYRGALCLYQYRLGHDSRLTEIVEHPPAGLYVEGLHVTGSWFDIQGGQAVNLTNQNFTLNPCRAALTKILGCLPPQFSQYLPGEIKSNKGDAVLAFLVPLLINIHSIHITYPSRQFS